MLRTEEVATPARSGAPRRSRYACVAREDLRRYAPHLFISISYGLLTRPVRAWLNQGFRFFGACWNSPGRRAVLR